MLSPSQQRKTWRTPAEEGECSETLIFLSSLPRIPPQAKALCLEKGHAATRPWEQLQTSTWRLILLFAPLTSAPPLWHPQGRKTGRQRGQESQARASGQAAPQGDHTRVGLPLDPGLHRLWRPVYFAPATSASALNTCRMQVFPFSARQASWLFPAAFPSALCSSI